MRHSIRAVLLIGVLAFVMMAPVSAHHSFAARFDMDKWITLNGKVTSLKLVNPHPLMEMEVTEADGTVSKWLITSMTSANALRNAGWTKDTVAIGMTIKLEAHPALLAGSKTVCAGTVTLPSGKQHSLGGTLGVAAG